MLVQSEYYIVKSEPSGRDTTKTTFLNQGKKSINDKDNNFQIRDLLYHVVILNLRGFCRYSTVFFVYF